MRQFMSSTRFVLLWGLGSIASLFGALMAAFLLLLGGGMVFTAIFGEQLLNLAFESTLLIFVAWFGTIGLVIGLIFGSIQKAILRAHTRDPWRGWLISSMLGGTIGMIVTFAVIFSQGLGYVIMRVIPTIETMLWWGFQGIVILFGCLGLCQMFALRRYTHGAWVWILANIVAAVVLYSLVAFGVISWTVTPLIAIGLMFFVAATPGIVTGFAMVWLINSNWRQGY